MSLQELEPNPLSVRAPSDEDLERLKGLYPSLERALKICVTCRNAHIFKWRDGNDIVTFRCPCDEQLGLHLWLLNAGLDLRYQRLGWSDAVGVEHGVTKTIMDYAEHAQAYATSGVGLVLIGRRGTGKTMISALLLKELMSRGFTGYFSTFQGLLDLYTAGWGKNTADERLWYDRKIKNVGVLVVDDMGREHDGRLPVAEAAFDDVLRARVAADRPTIITSNRGLQELGELYSLNAMSLLDECTLAVEFTGEDYRPTQRGLRLDEARQGLTRPLVVS